MTPVRWGIFAGEGPVQLLAANLALAASMVPGWRAGEGGQFCSTLKIER